MNMDSILNIMVRNSSMFEREKITNMDNNRGQQIAVCLSWFVFPIFFMKICTFKNSIHVCC